MVLDVLNQHGEKTGKQVELSAAVFGCEGGAHLAQQAVRLIRNNARQGTASTKEKWAVSASTRKLYKQKGTGRARAGSAKSPIRRHGGTMFGPRPGRDYGFLMNKKERLAARKVILSERAKQNQLLVLDTLALSSPNTKQFAAIMHKLGLKGQRILVVTPSVDRQVVLSARNIPKIEVVTPQLMNAYDLLLSSSIVMTEEALALVEQKHA